MGLDITWYAKIVPAPDALLDRDGAPVDSNIVLCCPSLDFRERCTDIADGTYLFGSSGSFRAGSYGGYNRWREQLAKLAGYPATPGDYIGPMHLHSNGAWVASEGLFHELIHFTDCDGVIGTSVSAKLASDFADFQDAADTHGGPDFCSIYAKFRAAFEAAADNGFVRFH